MPSRTAAAHLGRIAVIRQLLTALIAMGFGSCCLPLPTRAEYLLASGDILEISIVGLREMHQSIPINVDGQAFFPLVGPIRAAGLSLVELQQKVRQQLPAKIFRRRTEDGRESQVALSPDEITVSISEYRPIYIDGDVAKPGAVGYRAGMRVRQAIALAGGYDTARFTGRDPFLEAADFRAEYYSLWTEFAKQQVRISRLKAELADNTQIDRQGFVVTPVGKSTVSQIEDLEARQLTARNDDRAKEKDFLRRAINEQQQRVAALSEDAKKEKEGAAADASDFDDLREKFRKGIIPMLRLSDARRFTLYSASQALQTSAMLALAERERQELSRRLERVDDQRRINLLNELQEAQVNLESIRSRLQAIGDKLMYTGVVKSQLIRGVGGGEPRVKVVRYADGVRQILTADADTELMPGDAVEIALRLEALTSSSQPDTWVGEH
jgi:polysaccharide export outer membrane protein